MSNPYRWKRPWQVAAIGAAAAGIMLLATGCGGSGTSAAAPPITPASGQHLAGFPGTSGTPSVLPTAMPSGMAGMAMPSTAPSVAAKPVAADAVTILNFAFGPQVVTVKAGTTVHWTNHDSEAHTVTSDTGAFGSPVLQSGTGYSFTFTKPGIYSYHCTIHPFMTGKVVVS
jgi:amicyanin